ncbi:MAG: hypothetical protein K2M82_06455 [Lachnospiraceae bacterium]|nr:hypothetical protein [Lachnospiraceae bacterium]
MEMNEKVAYIRGLMDGLKLNENDDTIKVIKSIVDLLEDITDQVDDLGELYDELSAQVDEIDQDLSIVEDDLYDEDEDEDRDFDDFDEDEEYYEVVCPTCGDEICVSEDILLEGSIDCPNCGEVLEFDFSELCADDINGDCEKCSSEDCDLKED